MPIAISQAHSGITQLFIKLGPALEAYKIFYDAGLLVAAIDALELVSHFNEGEENVSLPAWLFHAAHVLAKERLESSKSITKGQLGSEGKTALRNHKVLVRYVTVMKLKHDKITWELAFEEASRRIGIPSYTCLGLFQMLVQPISPREGCETPPSHHFISRPPR